MLNRIVIIIICISCSSCYSNVDKSLIDNWKSYSIPTSPDTLRNYYYSPNEWRVFIKDNKVHVAKNQSFDDKSLVPFKISHDGKEVLSALQVDDGYLIGFNRGEWGGHLDWFSKDGKVSYEISGDEIVQFIKRKGKNYAIQGLAHLTMSTGSILIIEKENGKWVSKEYLKLPVAPNSIGLGVGDDFFIITNESLLKIDGNRKVIPLVNKGFWFNNIYSDSISIVVKENIVYAGMRAGVYKYNLLTGMQEWLLPY